MLSVRSVRSMLSTYANLCYTLVATCYLPRLRWIYSSMNTKNLNNTHQINK